MKHSLLALAVFAASVSAQTLEPPPPVGFWSGSGQVVDYNIFDLTGCSAYWYLPPDNEYSEWVAWAGAVDLKALTATKGKEFLSAVYDKDFAKALTFRTLPMTDQHMQNLAAPCKARLVRPDPVWKVAAGLGARNGTRPMYELVVSSGVTSLGSTSSERAVIGDRCWCGNPLNRVITATQVYCKPYNIQAVTICKKS